MPDSSAAPLPQPARPSADRGHHLLPPRASSLSWITRSRCAFLHALYTSKSCWHSSRVCWFMLEKDVLVGFRSRPGPRQRPSAPRTAGARPLPRLTLQRRGVLLRAEAHRLPGARVRPGGRHPVGVGGPASVGPPSSPRVVPGGTHAGKGGQGHHLRLEPPPSSVCASCRSCRPCHVAVRCCSIPAGRSPCIGDSDQACATFGRTSVRAGSEDEPGDFPPD